MQRGRWGGSLGSGSVDELHSGVAAVCMGLGGRMGSCFWVLAVAAAGARREVRVRRGKVQDVGDERMDPATDGVANCRQREGGGDGARG